MPIFPAKRARPVQPCWTNKLAYLMGWTKYLTGHTFMKHSETMLACIECGLVLHRDPDRDDWQTAGDAAAEDFL